MPRATPKEKEKVKKRTRARNTRTRQESPSLEEIQVENESQQDHLDPNSNSDGNTELSVSLQILEKIQQLESQMATMKEDNNQLKRDLQDANQIHTRVLTPVKQRKPAHTATNSLEIQMDPIDLAHTPTSPFVFNNDNQDDPEISFRGNTARPQDSSRKRKLEAETEEILAKFRKEAERIQLSCQAPAPQQQTTRDDAPLFTNQGMQDALEHLLGPDTGTNPSQDYFDDILLEGCNVDDKLKDMIWGKKFVELGQLVSKIENKNRLITQQVQGGYSQIALAPVKVKSASNIHEWISWFCIYATIYTQRYPEESPQIFGYILRIMELQKEEPTSYMWRHYDELFRQARYKRQSMEWHIVDDRFVRKAKVLQEKINQQRKQAQNRNSNNNNNANSIFRNRNPGNNSSTNGNSSRVMAPCHLFNQGKHCTYPSCRFSHTCSTCRGAHPATQCKPGSAANTKK